MSLLNNGQQLMVSQQRRLPVDNVGSDAMATISETSVQFYYYNAGVLTTDAGQAAGTAVVAKLSNRNVKNAIGDVTATEKDTSLTFTSTAFTSEVPFPHLIAEQNDQQTGLAKLTNITSGFTNGQYCVDYRTGTLFGKKASNQTALSTVSYKVETSSSTLVAGDVEIGAVELKNSSTDDRALIKTGSTAAVGDLALVVADPNTLAAVAIPTTIVGGTKSVTTAGTAIVLGTSTAIKSVYIRALSTNGGNIYVGGSTVDSSNGIALGANDSVSIDIANLGTVYIDSDVNGEGVGFTYFA